MTVRKKKGTGFLISGAVFIIGGVVLFTTTSTPLWLPTCLTIIGMVAKALGFTTVFPDTD